MKKCFFIIFFVSLLSLSILSIKSNSLVKGDNRVIDDSKQYVHQEILVKFRDYQVGDINYARSIIYNTVSLLSAKIHTYLNQEINLFDWDPSNISHRSFIGDPSLFHLKLPEDIDINNAISFLSSLQNIEYVEKNLYGHIDSIEPNDEYFYRQWSLKNTTSRGNPERPETTPYCDIHAIEAWNISTGNPDIVVAVLDSGIVLDHEDLSLNIWTNPNDNTYNQSDDDNNSFTDDVHGWDFTTPNGGDNVPEDGDVFHGTSVSGIIGAIGNNTSGISGVCWNVKIMPLKTSVLSTVINAVDYAILNGAHILNGCFHYDKNDGAEPLSLKAAITRAMQKNRIYVCSAGNYQNGQDIDNPQYPSWPSNWTIESILSVLATDYIESLDEECVLTESNYGNISVDIGAPGEAIYTTTGGVLPPYRNFRATSAATPHVSGVAALILGICPGLTSTCLKELIVQNVDIFPDLIGKCVSGGRLNAKKVLDALGGTVTPNAPSNLSAYPIAWNKIQLSWNDNSNNELGFEIQRKDNYQSIFVHDNSADAHAGPSAAFANDNIQNIDERIYEYRIRASNKSGSSIFSNTASTSVPHTLPQAPSDLHGQSPAFYPLVNISWSNNAVNTLYNFLERRIPGYTNWKVVATLSYNTDVYTDSSASSGNIYEYRVRAWNPIGYSAYSNVIAIEVISW